MSSTAFWVRSGIVVVLVPLGVGLGIAVFHGGDARRTTEAAAIAYSGAYDQIEFGMLAPRVDGLLGSNGEWLEWPELPRAIGEVTGFANGCTIPRQSFICHQGDAAHLPTVDLSPARAVRWRAWLVPGGSRWIVVGFVNQDWNYGTPVVLTKRYVHQSNLSG